MIIFEKYLLDQFKNLVQKCLSFERVTKKIICRQVLASIEIAVSLQGFCDMSLLCTSINQSLQDLDYSALQK